MITRDDLNNAIRKKALGKDADTVGLGKTAMNKVIRGMSPEQARREQEADNAELKKLEKKLSVELLAEVLEYRDKVECTYREATKHIMSQPRHNNDPIPDMNAYIRLGAGRLPPTPAANSNSNDNSTDEGESDDKK
ncbi:MAG: hypothetical protein ABSG01_09420 [Anaerolineales bacterium]|jgi:hypothetical protein